MKSPDDPSRFTKVPDSYDRLRYSGDAEGAVQPSQIARDPFTLPEEPAIVSYCPLCRVEFDTSDPSAEVIPYRRHDDIDPIKRAHWEGVFLGIAVGVVLTMGAVAWRTFGTLLP